MKSQEACTGVIHNFGNVFCFYSVQLSFNLVCLAENLFQRAMFLFIFGHVLLAFIFTLVFWTEFLLEFFLLKSKYGNSYIHVVFVFFTVSCRVQGVIQIVTHIFFYLYNFDIFVYLCDVYFIFRVVSYFLSLFQLVSYVGSCFLLCFSYFLMLCLCRVVISYPRLTGLLESKRKIIIMIFLSKKENFGPFCLRNLIFAGAVQLGVDRRFTTIILQCCS